MHHVPASAPPVGVLLLGACRARWRMEPAPAIGRHARRVAKESSETIREQVRWKIAGPLGLLLLFAAGCASNVGDCYRAATRSPRRPANSADVHGMFHPWFSMAILVGVAPSLP